MKMVLGFVAREILLPISLVLTLISFAFWIGILSQKVNAIDERDSPTRYEFNNMCLRLDEIKKGVDSINNYLINNK